MNDMKLLCRYGANTVKTGCVYLDEQEVKAHIADNYTKNEDVEKMIDQIREVVQESIDPDTDILEIKNSLLTTSKV